ncbi:MAG: hypothetical protein ACC652_00130, partial [Acidimicrobiales bacterium]
YMPKEGQEGAPEFVGEMWTRDLIALSLAHWTSMSRAEAGGEAGRIANSPGLMLGSTVGGRIRADARLRAQRVSGKSFDLCAYHQRALQVAPGGAALLRDELELVAKPQQTSHS